MKKGKLLLLLVTSALTFGSLVGCNVNVDIKSEEPSNSSDVSSNPASSISSSSQQNISSNSSEAGNSSSQAPVSSNASSEATSSAATSSQPNSSSEAVTYDWSAEELAIFKEHLYDYYLPHPNKPGVTLRAIEGVSQGVVIAGGMFLEGELASYASQYRAMGWTGGAGSEFGSGIPAGAQYIFTKYFNTPQGKRYLIVTFGCTEYDESGSAKPSTKGLFYLEAVDPYLYSYDDVMNTLARVVNVQGIANDLPPELPGVTSYYIEPNEADGSVLLSMAIDSTSAESDFTTILRNNGWTIVNAADGATGKSAVSPNGVLEIQYSYDANQKVLILTIGGVDAWNNSLVENFFRKYNQTPVDIKPLDIEGASYVFAELPENETAAQTGAFSTVRATMTVYSANINKGVFDEYVKEWKDNGYVANTDDNSSVLTKMIGEDSLYQVIVMYLPADDGARNGISVIFAAAGMSGSQREYLYPREQLATFLNGLTDSLPMIEARNAGYMYDTAGDVFAMIIYSDEEGAFNAISGYKTKLRQSGYEPDASNANKFLSRNGEISVELNSTSGIITMVINRIDTTPQIIEWPADMINQAITVHISPSITDTLPELTISEATNCYVNTNFSSGFEIVIEGLGSSSNAYKSVFKSNGWVEDPFYQYDNNSVGALISPNNQLAAHLYVDVTGVNTSDLVIMVSSYSQPLYNPWPAEMINEYLEEDGVTKDTIPAFDKALYFRHAGSAKEFKVYFYTSNNEVALQLYNDSLKMSGYNMDSELKGYVSANSELLIKTGTEKLDGFDYVMVYVKYIGPEPEVKPVYKIVGTMNEWSYESSEIELTDFPDASLASQVKAVFEVEEGDEFKVYDGSGNAGWFGYEIFEPNDNFASNGGNIKAKEAGTVTLYFKTYKDGSKGIAVVFTPAPTPWPSDELAEFFGDEITTIPEVDFGEGVSYEVKSKQVIEGKMIVRINASVAISGEDMLAYKERFARTYGYVENPDNYALIAQNAGYPNYSFANNETNVDIYITYEKPAEPEVAEWPGEEIAEYFGEVFDAIPEFEIEDNTSFEITQRVDNDINKFMVINADTSLDGDQLARYINAFAETYGYTRNTDNQHYYSENAGYPEYMFSNNGTSVDIYVIYVKPQTEPVEWPLEEIDAIVEDAWEIENIVPIIEDECITDIQIEDYDDEEDVSFTIVISNGAELKAAYESLLEDNFICNEGSEVWVAVSGTMQIGVAVYGEDLYVFVNFRQKAGDYDRWPEVQLIDFFDNDCDFYPWSAKTEALYNIEYSPEDADYQHAGVTVTVNNDGAEEAMNDAVVAILREFGAETGSPLAYVYDEETGILYSPSEEAPTYEFTLLDENNFMVLVNFVKPEIEPEPVEWPQDDIDAIMVDIWEDDDVVPAIDNENLTGIEIGYNAEDLPNTFVIRLYGCGDLSAEYEEQIADGFEYNEEKECWISTSGKTALSFDGDEEDFWIAVSLIEQEEPISSYEAAIAELHDYFGEDIIFPDVEIEGAVEYSVSDSDTLVITFAEGTDLDEKWEEIKTLIENSDAYHYFRMSQWYENAEQGMSCGPYIDIPTNSVCLFFSCDQFYEEDYYLGYLSPSDDHYIGNGGAAFSYDSEVEIGGKTYTQYIAEDVYFDEDLLLTVYNGETKQEFRVQIDEWSLDQNYDDYLEWNEEAQAYAVKQPFTGTFYLKIRYGEDILYIAFYN